MVSSNRSRSSGGLQALAGRLGCPWVIRNGLTARYASKNGSMSTIRSLSSGRPLIGSTVTSFGLSIVLAPALLQPNRFRPLIRIASDPQTPCAHDRRKVSVPSMYHLM